MILITAIAFAGLLIVSGLCVWAYRLHRMASRLPKMTDEQLRQFREHMELQAEARAKLFGDNIYDIHRSR